MGPLLIEEYTTNYNHWVTFGSCCLVCTVVLAVMDQLTTQTVDALRRLADRVIPAQAPDHLMREWGITEGLLYADMLPELGKQQGRSALVMMMLGAEMLLTLAG